MDAIPIPWSFNDPLFFYKLVTLPRTLFHLLSLRNLAIPPSFSFSPRHNVFLSLFYMFTLPYIGSINFWDFRKFIISNIDTTIYGIPESLLEHINFPHVLELLNIRRIFQGVVFETLDVALKGKMSCSFHPHPLPHQRWPGSFFFVFPVEEG